MTPNPLRNYTCLALVISALFAGCSTTPGTGAPAQAVSTTPPLEHWMTEAARARQEGARGLERDIYRKAAQAYPTSKEPWLKLAEGYFDQQDYGNAILAAQEVLQRDAADKVANSYLAVSGLRVSSTALSALRQRQDLSADTRDQAQEVVKTLRDVLGEPVLVPKPADAAAGSGAGAIPRPKPRPKPVTPATGNVAPAMPTQAPAPAKPSNPFDTLK